MDVKKIAQKLYDAQIKCSPIDALTVEFPEMTIQDAYKIQLENIAKKKLAGAKVIGKKIGLTSKAMQNLIGVEEPDYGHLLDDMLLLEGEHIERERLLHPKVESEISFVLGEALKGPGINITDVLRATKGVIASLEIVDSRIRDWKIKLPDTIADNASSAAFVLGGKLVPVEGLDLRYIGMVFQKNGEVVGTGAGAAVWNHPAASVAWLANKLSEFGIALEAGEIVMSGAFTEAVSAEAGDIFSATFDRLGSVAVKFI